MSIGPLEMKNIDRRAMAGGRRPFRQLCRQGAGMGCPRWLEQSLLWGRRKRPAAEHDGEVDDFGETRAPIRDLATPRATTSRKARRYRHQQGCPAKKVERHCGCVIQTSRCCETSVRGEASKCRSRSDPTGWDDDRNAVKVAKMPRRAASVRCAYGRRGRAVFGEARRPDDAVKSSCASRSSRTAISTSERVNT